MPAPDLGDLPLIGELSPVVIFRADDEGQCFYVNELWAELSGRPLESALGTGWAQAVHPDDRDEVLQRWAETLTSGENLVMDVRLLRPDGEIRWVLGQVTPFLQDGETSGFLGTLTDITLLKSTEQALRDQKQLSESIILSSMDGILAFDRDYRYTVWNPGMERISGVSRAQAIGNRAFDVFPFLVEIGEDAHFTDALRGETTVSGDRPYTVPSTGREGFFEARYSPLRDARGEVIGGLSIVHDITDRKAAMDALRSAQSQVVQAGKLAAMGELGAGIAHELNQPLAGIKMLVSLMRKQTHRPVGAFLRELELIADQVDRMAKIVDNVRGFARESSFTPGVVEPLLALEDALMLMSEQMRLAGIEVERDIAPDLPTIRADSVQLQQVFLNLLSNAHHALEERASDRRLHLEVRRRGECVRFSVEDNGPGIPDAVAERIFDPFYTTKETGRGTGLGLSLAYGIVKAHGGTIHHEPGRDGGARFRVEIPAAPLPPPAPQAQEPAEAPPSSSRGRVLIVDDEPVLRQVLSECVEVMGYPNAIAGDPTAAEAALAEGEFWTALVDLKMPGVSGFDLFRRLREAHPSLHLLAMSGFITDEGREELLTLGVKAILSKPFDTDHLEQVLADLP